DQALVSLGAAGEYGPWLAPFPDLDVCRAGQAIDVVDLSHAADGEMLTVGRERQGANAAQRAFALAFIIGVEDWHLKALGQLAGICLPDAHGADPITAGQVLAIRAGCDRVQGSNMVLRRPL